MRDPLSGETVPTELAALARTGDRAGRHRRLATGYCVKAAALDAVALGFETAVTARRSPPWTSRRAMALAPGGAALRGVALWSTRMR
jgi:hypothetical protein